MAAAAIPPPAPPFWFAAMQEIEIQLNGQPFHVAPGSTVAGLVRQLQLAEDRVAVELDCQIVRRAEWSDQLLQPGSRIEIVQIVGGG